ncbi:DsbA family oxidoreductase [Oceanobacter mangrovi]|uniref:DsbA family oxidoreductase n=1 Tax=Oceanobacter mangrovi TaxID=2862510 RepID=UPI001C8D65CC|nr:DsbA family oxidoreductase [Oceanobacter mangrovi]
MTSNERKTPVKIDFVSDVVCPWCAIGLASLLKALELRQRDLKVEIHFRPFELSPGMAADGELVMPYLRDKYGLTEQQVRENHSLISQRGNTVGFRFDFNDDSRKWNTFDAHRLLHWVATLPDSSKPMMLKFALLQANFTDNRNVSHHDVLVAVAEECGLNGQQARDVLEQGLYADEVRNEEQLWQERGIRSVPAMILNDQYLINGAQPPQAILEVIDRLIEASH